MCHSYHPWRALLARTDVVVHWQPLDRGRPAATDGAHRIWIDPRLGQAERRCAVTHELVHVECGHRGCQPDAVEQRVRATVARRLVGLDALARAVRWSLDVAELAEELWVTPLVLTDRVAVATPAELDALAAAAAHHHA